jgi:hypothetical protein
MFHGIMMYHCHSDVFPVQIGISSWHQAALEVLNSLETHPWLAPMRPWLAKIHEVWPQAGRR